MNKKLSSGVDGDDFPAAIGSLGFFQQSQTSTVTRFFLDEDILDLSYYRNLLQMLLTASEGDMVELHISSVGGQLDSAEAIISAIRQTDALVIAVVHKAYSAASMITLACHEIVLNEFSTIMVHSASYSTGGSHSNVRDYADFAERKLNKMFDDIYEGFLTAEEIDKVKSGTEIWMISEEIGERLAKRQKHFQEKYIAEKEEEEKPQPKRKKVKKDVVEQE